jgi:lipopolysaccharide transport system ATP-binding protein
MSSNTTKEFPLPQGVVPQAIANKDDIAIRVTNLSKSYEIYATPRDRLKQFVLPRLQRVIGQVPKQYFNEFSALKDVSFEVKKGETVGIIGRNGSGKSTLLQMICGTLNPTNGSIQTNGRIAALLELGSGFNPEFTGRENVYLNASVLGLSHKEIEARFDKIVAFADIGDFIEQPVKTYSSGMYVRLAFAVVVHVDADILIIDEALAVGDAFFQAKCMSMMKRILDSGTTILFVSHDINTVKALCKRTLWLDNGTGRAFGETADVARTYAQEWIVQANGQHLPTVNVNEQGVTPSVIELQTDSLNLEKKLLFSGRSGTGHAQFVAFQAYCGQDPIGILPLEFGSTLRLVCLIEIIERCDHLIVGFHLKDRNNQHLVGVNSGAMADLYDRVWQRGERFQIEFQIPVCLQAGRYAITALISSLADVIQYTDVRFIDWLEDTSVFEVAPRNPFPLSDWVEIEHEIKFSVFKTVIQ